MVLIVVFLNDGNLVRFLCPAARLAKCPNSRCNNGLQETSVECCFEWESSSILVLRNFEMAWISAGDKQAADVVPSHCSSETTGVELHLYRERFDVVLEPFSEKALVLVSETKVAQ